MGRLFHDQVYRLDEELLGLLFVGRQHDLYWLLELHGRLHQTIVRNLRLDDRGNLHILHLSVHSVFMRILV